MKTIIYLHGFNSSPQSEKARITSEFFSQHFPDIKLEIPNLVVSPKEAIESILNLVAEIGEDNVLGVIGSSLGGYYSIYLKSVLPESCKIVLINPAIRPFELLEEYIGLNTNYHTGEQYEVKQEHMFELKELFVSNTELLRRYDADTCLLLTQTLDEVLDYRAATDFLPTAKVWIWAGGDHAFQCFHKTLPLISKFLKCE